MGYMTGLWLNRAQKKAISDSGRHIHRGPKICLPMVGRWASSICTRPCFWRVLSGVSHVSPVRSQPLLLKAFADSPVLGV